MHLASPVAMVAIDAPHLAPLALTVITITIVGKNISMSLPMFFSQASIRAPPLGTTVEPGLPHECADERAHDGSSRTHTWRRWHLLGGRKGSPRV